jgi:uncharacterized integral membrane protein
VILLVFFVAIAVQNSAPDITVKVFTWTQTMPLWIVIFASALMGFVVGMLVSVVREIRLRLDSGKLRRERDEYQREIARLRAAPLDQLSSSVNDDSGGDSLL